MAGTGLIISAIAETECAFELPQCEAKVRLNLDGSRILQRSRRTESLRAPDTFLRRGMRETVLVLPRNLNKILFRDPLQGTYKRCGVANEFKSEFVRPEFMLSPETRQEEHTEAVRKKQRTAHSGQ